MAFAARIRSRIVRLTADAPAGTVPVSNGDGSWTADEVAGGGGLDQTARDAAAAAQADADTAQSAANAAQSDADAAQVSADRLAPYCATMRDWPTFSSLTGVANRTHYARVVGKGAAGTTFKVHVNTSTGASVTVAAYNNNGSEGTAARPTNRIGSSAAAAPGGTGMRSFSLTVTVPDGGWLAVTTPDTTFKLWTMQAPEASQNAGRSYYEDGAACPSTVGTLVGAYWIPVLAVE